LPNLLYRTWTKGTAGETGLPRYSADWALARRAWFKCYADRVECGDWVIQAADVRDAVLYDTRQWFLPVFVLAVLTDARTYQFGFNPLSRVASHLPFSIRRECVRLGHSPFSIAVRLLLAYAAFLVWRYWRRT
jgi:hypothetical protein